MIASSLHTISVDATHSADRSGMAAVSTLRPPRAAASTDRNPFAMVRQRLDGGPQWAETAPRGKARLPAHLRHSRSRSATAAIRRLLPSGRAQEVLGHGRPTV